ncbi:DUF4142 domain-containing protein [Actinomadura rubrisoli]|uniref:DUF4142 domain-containing protein n=1 Tax=Actinomadura rubrisoli TaxID=2530368 RepID=A0A4R5APZ3_9ACTN|nr:DUF4142 domain-containing protein [Actinomadura rubrisoli]TDD73706.1 DUF4142 domain-containing protein [Actinomadura rubrisoli]
MFPRLGRGRVLLLLAAVAAVVAAFAMVLSPAGGLAPADGATRGGTTKTRWGPMGALDRTLLVKVRQAGLWEMPAGQQAQQRASSPRVKEVGNMIMQQHMALDADTRATAQRLDVLLPTEPNGSQKSWLREMSGKFGGDYDKTFVLRLRAAHGQVFSVIAKVRAQTENSEIRAFAERAMKFVSTHMSLLESTGLVTRSALH